MARVIDGKAVARALRVALQREVQALTAQHGRPPALGLIMLGDRKDSALYVRTKRIACEKAGIRSVNYLLPETADPSVVLQQIDALNRDAAIDGILVQLPLPDHVDAQRVIDRIRPTKDVDGLHPFNVGELAMRHRYPYLVPCTAKGILALLDAEGVALEGKTAVVLGRSNLVGTPVTLMLQKRNATVIQCHSRTVDLPRYVRQADVLVVACGQPYLVRGEWLKRGAVVVDVGINFVQEHEDDDDTRPALYHGTPNADGFKIVGDVHYGDALQVASAVTPVPGGVGPMTIAMLLHNVVAAYKRHVGVDGDGDGDGDVAPTSSLPLRNDR